MRMCVVVSMAFVGIGLAFAQETKKELPSASSLDPAIKKADDLFEAEVAKAEEAFNKAKRTALEARLKVYRDRQRTATKAGNLDQALAIKSAIESLEESEEGFKPRPKDVVRLGTHSYSLIKEPATWNVAKKRCAAMGGHLVTIENAAELELVKKFITNQVVWIGASDEEKEGEWRWVTGQLIPPEFLAQSKIDNHQGMQHSLIIGSIGNVEDETPAYRQQYICEWDK